MIGPAGEGAANTMEALTGADGRGGALLRRLVIVSLAVFLGALLWGALSADRAEANNAIKSVETTPNSTQAGAHPDMLVSFGVNYAGEVETIPCHCNVTKDVTINTPPGFLGIPRNLPRCTNVEFVLQECPVESQVGVAYINYLFGDGKGLLALFNMVPRDDQAGLLAIETPILGAFPIYTSFTVRTESDYGLEAKTFGLPGGAVQLKKASYVFWGVPGLAKHDELRAPLPPNGWLKTQGPFFEKHKQTGCGADVTYTIFEGAMPEICEAETGVLTPYNGPSEPFLSAPTRCGHTLHSTIGTLSYGKETDFAEASFPTITGCDVLSFDPTLTAKPTTTEADSPSGLDVDLVVPQSKGPDSPSASQIRSTVVELPAGMSVNANAANGKVACTDAEAKFGSRAEAECPENSKIGSLAIESSALPGVLPGAVYLGEPQPRNRYRVFLVADGFSLHIKLAGVVTPDPETGQVRISFTDLPQTPFERFTMHMFGAERGLLATPPRCGTYPVTTTFEPWAEELPDQESTQLFTIDSGPGGTPCPGPARPFAPEFVGGSADNAAGAHSSFSVQLSRRDGDQNLAALTVRTPRGFSGYLKGIPYCPETAVAQVSNPLYSGLAEMEASACPAASQIGVASAGSGTGGKPLYTTGRVYLAGPYKGAPLSLVVLVPAVSGPYDLGNVAVRAAIQVDPNTAQVTTVSDRLPQIVEGIPLRTRSITVALDRPNFAVNPTNCQQFAVEAFVGGVEGGTASLSSPFQAANCATLGYRPKLRVRLRGNMKRRGHPAIISTLRAVAGEANSRRIAVTLPRSELLDNAHIDTVCTRVQYAGNACPKGSRLGFAKAWTPLLDRPLAGPVHLRSSPRRLPDIVVSLRGQISLDLVGRVDSINGGLRTTFEALPDAAVNRFALRLSGGAKGLLINSEPLCGSRSKVVVKMLGQNGRRGNRNIPLETACGKKAKRRRTARLYQKEAVR